MQFVIVLFVIRSRRSLAGLTKEKQILKKALLQEHTEDELQLPP